MPKRTRAANALALPADPSPDRRTLLAGAGAAAALIASTARALPTVDHDAALSTVRSRWLAAKMAQAVREGAGSPVRLAACAGLPLITNATTPTQFADIGMARSRIIARLQKQGALSADADADDDALWDEAFQAELRALDDRAATPARTLAGLAFKMDVLKNEHHGDFGLAESVTADVAAFAAAHLTFRI